MTNICSTVFLLLLTDTDHVQSVALPCSVKGGSKSQKITERYTA